MKYLYYPGCSVKSSGRHYEESLLAVFKALDTGMAELDDWNCCGATAYMSIDESTAFALAARNLALAEQKACHTLVAPCSACYLVLEKARDYMKTYPGLGAKVRGALAAGGLEYKGTVQTRHPLDVLVNDIGEKAIRGRVTRPLKGLRVIPYYGCQMVRPYGPNAEEMDPTSMDKLLGSTQYWKV